MKPMFSLLSMLTALMFIGTIVVNALATTLPINGVTPGEVSDSYPNLFAPAGFTFSIWGVIYLLLTAFTLYQLGLFNKTKAKNERPWLNLVRTFFTISSIANMLWIFSWHYRLIGLSVLLMLVILYCLIRIASVLRKEPLSTKDLWLVKTPFSVYFGWITVATIANITAFLVSVGFNGFGIAQEVWMVLILLVGTAIGIARLLYDRHVPYGLVFIWAYYGIYAKHTSPVFFNGQYKTVITTVLLCITLFVIANAYVLFRRKAAVIDNQTS